MPGAQNTCQQYDNTDHQVADDLNDKQSVTLCSSHNNLSARRFEFKSVVQVVIGNAPTPVWSIIAESTGKSTGQVLRSARRFHQCLLYPFKIIVHPFHLLLCGLELLLPIERFVNDIERSRPCYRFKVCHFCNVNDL